MLQAGYELLNTPHIANEQLWRTSGHTEFYKEDMFSALQVDEDKYLLKPMNCPFHCLIYKVRQKEREKERERELFLLFLSFLSYVLSACTLLVVFYLNRGIIIPIIPIVIGDIYYYYPLLFIVVYSLQC